VSAADEPVEVVDEHGGVERLVTRAEMRAHNLRHRTVAVVVLTGAGEIVAHRRADWKDVWPGRWDVCFGGVTAVGEDWADAARRELAEEAGVEVEASALRKLGGGNYTDADVSTHARVYLTVHDGPFHPADGEVAELVVVPLTSLDGWLAGRELCADSAAVVVPLLRGLARGDALGGPDAAGG
jgi:isopentenyldiphosphate isomerase